MLVLGWLAAIASERGNAQTVYQTPSEFLSESFPGGIPPSGTLELDEEMHADISQILGRHFGPRTVRYWHEGTRSAWVLEEIGRYRPITTGFVIEDGAIALVRVLIFRESHGWEVHHDFFTDQFKGLTLDSAYRLSADIDGISGATLSVNALRKLARLALYLDSVLHAQERGD